jgi:hypothetical protein
MSLTCPEVIFSHQTNIPTINTPQLMNLISPRPYRSQSLLHPVEVQDQDIPVSMNHVFLVQILQVPFVYHGLLVLRIDDRNMSGQCEPLRFSEDGSFVNPFFKNRVTDVVYVPSTSIRFSSGRNLSVIG